MKFKEVYYVFTVFSQILLFLTLASAQTSPTYVVTAPNILRYDVQESVVVTVMGTSQPVDVEVYIEDYSGPVWRTPSVNARANPDEPTEVQVVVPSSEEITSIDDKQYVTLVAKCDSDEIQFEKKVNVLVTPQNGFVFIQTDKPIYTPNQEVKIRVMQVDHEMKPSRSPVIIDILNPRNIVVERKADVVTRDGFYVKYFKFPALPVFGNWSARVHYGKDNRLSETVQFEVKKYVLPTFAVKIKSPEYILNKIYHVSIEVHAQYVYGKNVSGQITVRLGIQTENELKIFGTKNGQTGQSSFMMSFSTRDVQMLGTDFWFKEGAKLYVEATVLEQETGTKEVGKSVSGRFVSAPFNIKFADSRPHFKPGLPYIAKIDVLHANGKPAKETGINISATFRDQNGNEILPKTEAIALSNEFGKAELMTEVPANAYSALLSVTTHTEVRETEEFTVRRAFSASGSYIVASIEEHELPLFVADEILVRVSATKPNDITKLFYIVTARGKVILKGVTEEKMIEMHITASMSPSARLLVYYVHGSEIVADSLPIDVVDRCQNEVTVKTSKSEYKPGDLDAFEIQADPHTHVAILAVDQAVYHLNNQHRLTRKKMFSSMESFDTGCGVGSGLNSEDLIQNMGLTVMSNADIQGTPRTNYDCDNQMVVKRKRRRAMRIPVRPWLLTKAATDAQCCARGRQSSRLTCIQRMSRELLGVTAICRTRFLSCCEQREGRFSSNRHEEVINPEHSRPLYTSVQGRMSNSGRVKYTFEDIPNVEDVIDEIPARQNFDETWMFEVVETGDDGLASLRMTVPDSITTWVVQAVGMNAGSGMCVAEPTRTKVFTPFFIQLGLPYSVIRQEQIEVKATIFNYGDIDLPISIHSKVTFGICAKSRPGEPSDPIYAIVKSHNSTSVTFPVVPLEVGEYPIEVIAVSPLSDFRDSVTRYLNVIPEGAPTIDVSNYILDPRGELRLADSMSLFGSPQEMMSSLPVQMDVFDLVPPINSVPDSAQSRLSAIGTLMGAPVRQAIDGVHDMLKLPTGCGEQTMIGLAPTTYAALYLKNTDQLTDEYEDKAAGFIAEGYARELTFRKESGAFSVFPHYQASTWLTAFVIKVFCQAQKLPGVSIEETVVCEAISWLSSKQLEDGSFVEDQKLIHRRMSGSVTEGISLTAFVLISMAECQCSTDETREHSMDLAVGYLETHLDELQDQFLMAVVAYALKLSESEGSNEAYQKLKANARFDQVANTRFWSRGDNEEVSADDVEMTSYALLTALLHRDMDYTKAIVTWLNLHRGTNGAFQSTQDTVVALQALSVYSSETEKNRQLLLHSRVVRQNDSVEILEFDITAENAIVQRQEVLPHGNQYQVLTQGVGTGQMTVEFQYNVFTNSTLCRFDTSVTTREIDFWDLPSDDDDDDENVCQSTRSPGLELGGVPSARITDSERLQVMQPFSRFSRLRSRSRFGGVRPAAERFNSGREEFESEGGFSNREEGPRLAAVRARMTGISAQNIVRIKVCTKFLASWDTGMSIVEVGLFSGYAAVNKSVARLKKCNSTTYVMDYTVTSRTVVFYLSKVPHENAVCLEFDIQQEYRVGNTQPVAVNVKDYYHPDDQCTTFYHPEGGSELLNYICNRPTGQCKCSEGQCMKCYNVNKNTRRAEPDPNYITPVYLPIGMVRTQELVTHICDEVDYAYKVEVLEVKSEGSYYVIETQVLATLKHGLREIPDGSFVTYWMRASCLVDCRKEMFVVGKKYLVTGPEGIHYAEQNGTRRVKSTLNEHNYVVEWNDRSTAQNRKERRHAGKLAYAMRRNCEGNSNSYRSRFGPRLRG